MAYTQEQLSQLEKLLLRERDRAVRILQRYNSDLILTNEQTDGNSAFSLHMADQGTDAMEREKAFLLAGEEGRLFQSIDQALRRLYRDPKGYGHCRKCGKEIGFARLEAVPQAELCIDCQREQETGR